MIPTRRRACLLWRARRLPAPTPRAHQSDENNTQTARPDAHRRPIGSHRAAMATGRGPAVPGGGPGVGSARPGVPGPADRRPGGPALRAPPPGRRPRRAAPRASQEVADAVSATYGRTLTAEGVEHLIATRLEPLGLVVAEEAEEPLAPDARPAPAGAQPQGHARPGPPHPGARLAARAAVLAAGRRSPPSSRWSSPTSCSWSAAASGRRSARCSRRRRRPCSSTPCSSRRPWSTSWAMPRPAATAAPMPGEIGVGIYIVFPAFYTDVTDSYRLGRGGPGAHRPRRPLLQRADRAWRWCSPTSPPAAGCCC